MLGVSPKQKYKLDFESYIENSITRISNSLLTNMPLLEVDGMLDFKGNMDLFISQSGEREVFNISSYRRLFYETGELKNYYTELTKAFDKANTLKKYHHDKFHMLNHYIQNECIEKKQELLSSV